MEIVPDHAYVHYNLSLALSKLARHEQAVASYAKALAIKPDYVETHLNLGNALRNLQRWAPALVSYDQALAVKPDYAEAYYNRGLVLDQLERRRRHSPALTRHWRSGHAMPRCTRNALISSSGSIISGGVGKLRQGLGGQTGL